MHALDLVGPDGAPLRLVVRRYPAEKVRRRPDVALREYRTLELLRDLGLPAPRPVWVDPDGPVFGTATLVMTRLPGRALVSPRDPADWSAQLAHALATIHAAPLAGRDVGFLGGHAWVSDHVLAGPPSARDAWTADWAAVWSAMRAIWPDLAPTPRTLVHGDYWSGNALWHRGRLVGVVDWDGCAVGYPGWDVGNCRVDLAMAVGRWAPDAFLRAYEHARGEPVRNLAFWDLVAATAAAPDPIQWLPGLHDLGRTDLTPDLMRSRLRAFIADALPRAPRPGYR